MAVKWNPICWENSSVPCLRRAISVEEEYEAAGGEFLLDDDDNDDGWLATHGRPKETTHDDSDENLPSMESLEISKGRAIQSIPSYFGGEEEDVPDMAEYEDSESLVETDPWGAAFRVKGGIEEEQAAMKYLEKRECEYDTKSSVDFHKEGDEDAPYVTGVLVFTSAPDKETNKYYLGPAPLEEMARQIATAHGPCGNNRDYIFLLEKAMYNIGHEDEYVIELANEVRKELAKLKEKRVASSPPAPKSHLPPYTFLPSRKELF